MLGVGIFWKCVQDVCTIHAGICTAHVAILALWSRLRYLCFMFCFLVWAIWVASLLLRCLHRCFHRSLVHSGAPRPLGFHLPRFALVQGGYKVRAISPIVQPARHGWLSGPMMARRTRRAMMQSHSARFTARARGV
jgi:uncharacterized SAM-binding protein YcdF (DUF218 family)